MTNEQRPPIPSRRAPLWLDADIKLCVFLTLGGQLGFLWLAAKVMRNDTQAFDRAGLLVLRHAADPSTPLGPRWLETAARDLTSLGSHAVLTLVSLLAIGFLLMLRIRWAAVLVAGSVGGGMLLSTILKHLFDRPRPELVPHAVQVVTASFPSGHAMLSAVTYLTLGAMLLRLPRDRPVRLCVMAGSVALVLLVGLSRVYLGVHWPSDVLAGWCIGTAWAALCWMVARRFQRSGGLKRTG